MVERRMDHEAYCNGHHIVRRDGASECLANDPPIPEFDVRAPFAVFALAELELALESTVQIASYNVRATIAESILAAAKAKFAASERENRAMVERMPPVDSVTAAKVMLAEAREINLRFGVKQERGFLRMVRGLLERIEADSRRLTMAKNAIAEADKTRDEALREREAAIATVRQLHLSRDRARTGAHQLRAVMNAAGEGMNELDAFLGSIDGSEVHANDSAMKIAQ
jgi:hypothetical protein